VICDELERLSRQSYPIRESFEAVEPCGKRLDWREKTR
jgi:hypothetical protein